MPLRRYPALSHLPKIMRSQCHGIVTTEKKFLEGQSRCRGTEPKYLSGKELNGQLRFLTDAGSAFEFVAHAANRPNKTRLLEVILDLLAQTSDEIIDGPRGAVVVVAPDLLEDRFPRQNLTA